MKREENQNVEYKESWQDKYLEWICGYANAKGGTIYFGIEDGTKKPVGVKNANKLMEDIPNSIRNTMGIVADVVLLKKQGKDVIRVKVRPSAFPVSYRGSFHYRSGAVKLKLTGPALTQFLMEKSGREWDLSPTLGGFKVKDFTFVALKKRYEQRRAEKFDKSYMVSFGLAIEGGLLTNTGALLADECPLKHSRLFCTRWNGNDMSAGVMDSADDLEFDGGILQLLQHGKDFIRLHSRKPWHKRDWDRVEFPEYPERAVEEALTNALIHRDYVFTGSEIHVDIYDNRIEISSPGGMVDGTCVQDHNIRRVVSKRRNKTLADVLEKVELVERKGSGFKKILSAYETAAANIGRRTPQFESDANTFIVILPSLLYGFSNAELVSQVVTTPTVTPTVAPTVTPTVVPLVVQRDNRLDNVQSPSVQRLLRLLLRNGELSPSNIMRLLRIKDRADLHERFLRPPFRAELIEQTLPDKPHSRLQKYRLTERGLAVIESLPKPKGGRR